MVAVDKRRDFGLWLRSVRKSRDLSLVGASRRLGYATKGTLVGIECGQASIPVEKIHPLAELYGIDLHLLLEKLKECEPDLYEKFLSLERNFFQDFTRRLETLRTGTGARSSLLAGRGPDGEQTARHHAPYPSDFSLHFIYYQKLEDDPSIISLIPPEYFQMQQMTLDLQPQAPARASNVFPLFPSMIISTESERSIGNGNP